jgi:hypothetical protein
VPGDDVLVIPYGTSASPLDASGAVEPGVPRVLIDRREHRPLRLNNAPYAFAEPPDPIRLAALDERLGFLRDHLLSFCGLWDQLPRLFLTLYFHAVAAAIEANRASLEARAAASGGLFDYRDWSFSALCPLPEAHLPLPAGAVVPRLRTDLAFWTGTTLVAVELLGAASTSRERQAALAALRQSGVAVIEIAGSELKRAGERALLVALPAPFWHFWEGETLPSSPFGRAALDEIVTETESR